jgi:hypothetical protein
MEEPNLDTTISDSFCKSDSFSITGLPVLSTRSPQKKIAFAIGTCYRSEESRFYRYK